MKPVNVLNCKAAPLPYDDVDTDQIIPARYLTTVSRSGLGEGLFDAWRYNSDGSPNPNFVLNRPEYRDAEILLSGHNFGSGSSREHAVWALMDHGIRAVIAPSFADIFRSNSLKNGFLPIQLAESEVDTLFELVGEDPLLNLVIDLQSQSVHTPQRQVFRFEISPFRKHCLMKGLDDLGYLLEREPRIEEYERVSV
jgi:3-isopropylmalate/(R)-2-methylmalate dehydratase small subunit